MQFHLPIQFPSLEPRIAHQHKLMLLGSCFTEHMTQFLQRMKFTCVQNSHGILFNPMSVCKALEDVLYQKNYTEKDLFFLDEYWHSWYHHSDFSDLNPAVALQKINESIAEQHSFLLQADYLFITLGSAFAYHHTEENIFVSNNHRAPSTWFTKQLLSADSIEKQLRATIAKIKSVNPKIKIVCTISPVRHARDGVIENNRSKANLIEAVHRIEEIYYFPAYELVIDILRDYRFYDVDMVHPNYQATAYVWEQFVDHCIDQNYLPLLKKLDQLYKSVHHRAKDTRSKAHQRFMQEQLVLCKELKAQYPHLDLLEELNIFNTIKIIK